MKSWFRCITKNSKKKWNLDSIMPKCIIKSWFRYVYENEQNTCNNVGVETQEKERGRGEWMKKEEKKRKLKKSLITYTIRQAQNHPHMPLRTHAISLPLITFYSHKITSWLHSFHLLLLFFSHKFPFACSTSIWHPKFLSLNWGTIPF